MLGFPCTAVADVGGGGLQRPGGAGAVNGGVNQAPGDRGGGVAVDGDGGGDFLEAVIAHLPGPDMVQPLGFGLFVTGDVHGHEVRGEQFIQFVGPLLHEQPAPLPVHLKDCCLIGIRGRGA